MITTDHFDVLHHNVVRICSVSPWFLWNTRRITALAGNRLQRRPTLPMTASLIVASANIITAPSAARCRAVLSVATAAAVPRHLNRYLRAPGEHR